MEDKSPSSESVLESIEEIDEPEFEEYTLSELKELLEKAVEQEDYEKASKIRDEIKKREVE
jgi:uncharacterized protein